MVLVSLARLVGTMHNICKVRGSNPDHHQKIMHLYGYQITTKAGVYLMLGYTFSFLNYKSVLNKNLSQIISRFTIPIKH